MNESTARVIPQNRNTETRLDSDAMDRLQADYAKRMALPKPPKIDWATHPDCM